MKAQVERLQKSWILRQAYYFETCYDAQMGDEKLKNAFELIDQILEEAKLPGLKRGVFMGNPSLVMSGKSLIGSKDGKVLVCHCPMETKEILLESAPEIYFQSDHYVGCPAILIRPGKIRKDELAMRIHEAWAMNASKRRINEYQNSKG